MNGHPEFLELIAMSIDFDLTDEEFGRLSTHLARCPECRRAAEQLRGDATAIAAYPPPRLAPARSEQILRAVLRTPRSQPRWGLLAVAAMLTTIGGGILFAGFQLINDDDATPSEPPPSLVAEVSAPPSEAPEETDDLSGVPPDDGPPATPNTDLGETPPADTGPLAFPLRYSPNTGPVRIAATSDGGLWVTFTRGRDTVVTRLDAEGRGQPVVERNAVECEPFAADDGGARALCFFDDVADPQSCVDVCAAPRVYGWAAPGQAVPGFPVWLPSGISTATSGAGMVGSDLVTVTTEAYDEVVAEFGEYGSARITTVAVDSHVREGQRVPAPMTCCVIGPNGVAYGSTRLEEEGQEPRTQLTAFDENGMRPGWPIVVDGSAVSYPAFGPDGQLVYAAWINDGSRIARVNPDGSEAGPPIDLTDSLDWSPDGDAPIPPLVDERGRVWVVADGSVLGFDAGNAAIPGFPYVASTGLLERGECPPGDTGCGTWLEPPRLAPAGLIHTLENAPDGKGARLNVVNRDGSVRSGWPKTLQRPGATWESLTIGNNRRAYAVALEPEPGDQWSGSIAGYAPNGTRELFTVLFEP